MALVTAACGNNELDRYAYHTMRSRGIFGETGRFSLVISPGIVAECASPVDDDAFEMCARASGPLPTVRMTNGTLDETQTILSVTNLPEDVRWAVFLEPLFDSESQDQRCIRDGIGPTPGISTRLPDAHGSRLQAAIPPCAALVFNAEVPVVEAQESYSILVVGGGSVRESELRTSLTMLESFGDKPKFILFTNLVALRSSAEAFEVLREVMDEYGIPWGMLANADAISRGPERFIDNFGSLDYITRVLGVPLIALDTSFGGLSSAQLSFVERIRTCTPDACPPGVAMMSIPPVPLRRLDNGFFRSQALAHTLLAMLSERGVELLISGVSARGDTTNFGSFRMLDSGKWRRSEEAYELVIQPPAAGYELCDAGVSLMTSDSLSVSSARTFCATGLTCVDGVCLNACVTANDCDWTVGEVCLRGACRVPCDSAQCSTSRCDREGLCEMGPRVDVREGSDF